MTDPIKISYETDEIRIRIKQPGSTKTGLGTITYSSMSKKWEFHQWHFQTPQIKPGEQKTLEAMKKAIIHELQYKLDTLEIEEDPTIHPSKP